MNYEETIHFLYQATPAFEQKGGSAYKPGLERMYGMSESLGNPHQKLRTIHIGGTNGKGSVSSTLASVFIEDGLKVGLFTSPHLVSFRERIRINGNPISEDYVVAFVERAMPLIDKWRPSFFELTTLLAFDYFASQKVDIAIVEVGMGGRLDCTNILHPLLSVVTNVSLDHTQFLGNTLPEIAFEKAGIIKPSTPFVLGENVCQEVFRQKASALEAPFYTAFDTSFEIKEGSSGKWHVTDSLFGSIEVSLRGKAQLFNTQTILATLQVLRIRQLIPFTDNAVQQGFLNVVKNSHLLGRWQIVDSSPTVILDTGHNIEGIKLNVQQLHRERFDELHIVFGMVADKAWKEVLELLPGKAHYYFATPDCERGLSSEIMHDEAKKRGLEGEAFSTPVEAFKEAYRKASPSDLIYAGGSNYIVGDLLREVFPHLLEESFINHES